MRRAGWISMALAVAALAGCGGGGNSGGGNSGGGSGSSSAPSSSPGKSTSSGGASASKGQALFASLGCKGCHSISGASGAGPALNGVAGSTVKLDNGQTTTANDSYLMQSIEDPDAKIVKGFHKGVMSSTIKPGSVSKADAKALVAYIKSVH